MWRKALAVTRALRTVDILGGIDLPDEKDDDEDVSGSDCSAQEPPLPPPGSPLPPRELTGPTGHSLVVLSPVAGAGPPRKVGVFQGLGVLHFASKLQQRVKERRFRFVRAQMRAAIARGEVVSEVSFSSGDEKNLKQFQGDPAMYSEEALAKRERLRHHPKLQAAISAWWRDLPKKMKEGTGTIDRRTYLLCFVPVYCRLVPGSPVKEAQKAVLEDWENESRDGKIDENVFFKSMFTLADTWVDTTDGREYIEFITKLHGIVFQPGSQSAEALERHRMKLEKRADRAARNADKKR
eukprot:Hpha_TRINITY_DN31564_c0_g1::TRINITY_DN31564_c0_g1_i1::g.1678::m.1678